MARQKTESRQLFQFEIGFHAHMVAKMDEDAGSPYTVPCQKPGHDGCELEKHAKNRLESYLKEYFEADTEVKDVVLEQVKAGSINGKPKMNGLLKYKISAPKVYGNTYSMLDYKLD